MTGALSHADTLEISCHSQTRVLLPAMESVEIKKHTSYQSYSTTFTYKITEVQHLNYWERLQDHKLYSLHRRRERYIIIYIWKIRHHMVPNVDGTMGHKIKTRKLPRHMEHCVLFITRQTKIQHNPFKKM